MFLPITFLLFCFGVAGNILYDGERRGAVTDAPSQVTTIHTIEVNCCAVCRTDNRTKCRSHKFPYWHDITWKVQPYPARLCYSAAVLSCLAGIHLYSVSAELGRTTHLGPCPAAINGSVKGKSRPLCCARALGIRGRRAASMHLMICSMESVWCRLGLGIVLSI